MTLEKLLRVDELAGMFANVVLDPTDEQDISFLLVGPKGSGKSRAALSLSYHTAREIAFIRDDDYSNWPKYFNVDNIAVIDGNRATWVLTHTHDYDVINLDDIGVGYNCRNFATRDNQDKNDVMLTNRVERTVKIMTLPERDQLDKVPRNLITHFGNMTMKHKGPDLSELKLFRPVKNYRNGKQIEPYIQVGGNRWVRYLIPLPPKELDVAYAKLRKEAVDKLKAEKWARYEESHNCGGDGGVCKKTPQQEQMYERAKGYVEALDSFLLSGFTDKEAKKCAMKETGIARTTIREWTDKGLLKDLGCPI